MLSAVLALAGVVVGGSMGLLTEHIRYRRSTAERRRSEILDTASVILAGCDAVWKGRNQLDLAASTRMRNEMSLDRPAQISAFEDTRASRNEVELATMRLAVIAPSLRGQAQALLAASDKQSKRSSKADDAAAQKAAVERFLSAVRSEIDS